MSKWQPVWLVLCLALAYFANRTLKPALIYEMLPGRRTMATGSLNLESGGQRHELKLVTVALVIDELRPILASPQHVRLMWLRSPQEVEGSEPDVEVFVDLSGEGPAVETGADFSFLRERDLPVVAVAPGSSLRSRVRLPGDATMRLVRGGVVRLLRVLAVEGSGEAMRSRIEGSVQLTLDDGGAIGGTIDARLER